MGREQRRRRHRRRRRRHRRPIPSFLFRQAERVEKEGNVEHFAVEQQLGRALKLRQKQQQLAEARGRRVTGDGERTRLDETLQAVQIMILDPAKLVAAFQVS